MRTFISVLTYAVHLLLLGRHKAHGRVGQTSPVKDDDFPNERVLQRQQVGLRPGQFRVCTENDFKGSCEVFNIGDYLEKQTNNFPRLFNDRIDSVQWNLPDGIALTFSNNIPESNEFPESLSRARTFDMVGNDSDNRLHGMGMSNSITSFVWYKYDSLLGFVEIFRGGGLNVRSRKIFLSLYTPNQVHSMENWELNDEVSSMSFDQLIDTGSVVFYENSDGSGPSFTVLGHTEEKRASMSTNNIDNRISSFKWSLRRPIKQEIKDLTIPIPDGFATGQIFTKSDTFNNPSTVDQQNVITIEEENVRTVTTTITESRTIESSIEATVSASSSVLTGGTSTSLTVRLEASKSFTSGKSVSNTVTTSLSLENTINIGARTKVDASFIATLGTIPPTTMTTSATRFYDVPVKGSIRVRGDVPGLPFYKRDEEITVTVTGDVSVLTRTDMNVIFLDDICDSDGNNNRKLISLK